MTTQRLWAAPFDSAEEVVRFFGAMQAQEFAAAKWSIGQRARGVDEADVDAALRAGTIVRTHVLRPTWHFVLPEDLRWLLDLTAPRVHAQNAYYYRRRELDAKTFAKCMKVLARTVEGGKHATREELSAALAKAKIEAKGERLGSILMHAELEKVLVSGAPRGTRHTYASFDERVPRAKARDYDEALAELTRRFFVAHGPATVKDFARWSGLTLGEGRRGLAMVEREVERLEVDGRTYWRGVERPAPSSERAPRVDWVQGYDEVLVAYAESKDVVLARLAARPERADVFVHALLLDGLLVGHWQTGTLATQLYRRWKGAEAKAFDEAKRRYLRFLGK